MKIKHDGGFLALALFLALAGLCPAVLGQGALTPPGPPAPTMKSLAQIEPRTDVLTLSGNGNNQYLITQSGSYYLTTNIVGVASKNGINIQADYVTLDLNGFNVNGSASGSQAGITVIGQHVGLMIRHGTVSGWAGNGIAANSATDSQFEDLRILTNGTIGLKLGSGNTIARCVVVGNTDDGMDMGANCLVTACTLIANSNGILTGAGCQVSDCRINNNSDAGLMTGDNCRVVNTEALANGDAIVMNQNCTVIGCTAVNNYNTGITIQDGGCIKDSVVTDNGYGTIYSTYGISAGNDSTIIGCTANGNNGDGIDTGTGSTIKDSTADMNYFEGIYAAADSTLIGCTAWTNNYNGFFLGSECSIIHCNACANNGYGIVAGYSCLIKENTTASNSRYVHNGGAGIFTQYSGSRIEGNNSNSDASGIEVQGVENFIIHNTVRQAGLNNYSIVSGNMVGSVVYAASSGAITGSSGGSGLGTSDPDANFSF